MATSLSEDDFCQDGRIMITHFTNPHEFWFYYRDSYFKGMKLRNTIEHEIYTYVRECKNKNRPVPDFEEGDIVAFKYFVSQKYIRARIDLKYERSTGGKAYVVWALDYGFPMSISNGNMYSLPETLTEPSGIVICGGLAVIPAGEEFDSFTSMWNLIPKVSWSASTCNELKKLLDMSKSVSFSVTFHTKPKSDHHYWGDLKIETLDGKIILASDFLVEKRWAFKNSHVTKYRDYFASTKFVDVKYWKDQNDMQNRIGKIVETFGSEHNLKVDYDAKLKEEKKEQRSISKSKECDDEEYCLPIPYSQMKAKNLNLSSNSKELNMASEELLARAVNAPYVKDLQYRNLRNEFFNVVAKNESSISLDKLDKKSFYGNQQMPENAGPGRNKGISGEKEVAENLSNVNASKSPYDEQIRKEHKEFLAAKFVERLTRPDKCYSNFAVNSKENLEKTETKEVGTKKKLFEGTERCRLPAGSDLSREITSRLRNYSMPLTGKSEKNYDESMIFSKKKHSISTSQNEFSDALFKSENHPTENTYNGKRLNATSIYQNQLMKPKDSIQRQQNMDRSGKKESSFKKNDGYDEEIGKENTEFPESKFVKKHNSHIGNKGKKVLTKDNWMYNSSDNKFKGKVQTTKTTEEFNTNKNPVFKDGYNVPDVNKIEPCQREKSPIAIGNKGKKVLTKDNWMYNSSDNKFKGKVQTTKTTEEFNTNKNPLERHVPKIHKRSNDNNKENVTNSSLSDYGPDSLFTLDPMDRALIEEIEPMRKGIITEYQYQTFAQSTRVQKPGYAKTLKDCGLSRSVLEVMERMNHEMNRLEAFSWPHIMNGESTFVINPRSSGKTDIYLPAICSILHKFKINEFRCHGHLSDNGPGPMIVILVEDCSQVDRIYAGINRFVHKLEPKVKIVMARGQRDLKETHLKLLNGCEILITTPAGFMRLIEHNDTIPLLDANRIRNYVVDDADVLLNRSGEEFKKLFQEIFKLVNQRKNNNAESQLIVTSTEWNPHFENIISFSEKSLLLIGDFLEAAVYGKANITIAACSKNQKVNETIKFIKLHSINMKPVLIFCEDDEVLELCKSFKAMDVDTISYHKDSTDEDRLNVKRWASQDLHTSILICGGIYYHVLGLGRIPTLIHYSFPTTWTKFTQRFVVCSELYENLTRKQAQEEKQQPKAKVNSLVLFDEGNNVELRKFIAFMKRHRKEQNIPPKLMEIWKNLESGREVDRCKNILMLCPALMEFGVCIKKHTCKYRHILTKDDVDLEKYDIPESGHLKVKILKVISPTHFIIRLIEHKTEGSNWKTIRCPMEARMFNLNLAIHYSNEKNLKPYWPIKLNNICIFKNDNFVYRAIVSRMPSIENADVVQSFEVDIKLIDTGDIEKNVSTQYLFECDSKLEKFPHQAIEMRLLDMFPTDNEYSWDEETTNEVKELLTVKNDEIIWVKITRALSQCIWVNNVFISKQLSSLATNTETLILPRLLVKEGHARFDRELSKKVIQFIDQQLSLLNNDDETNNSLPKESFGVVNDFVVDSSEQQEENKTEVVDPPVIIEKDLIAFSSDGDNDD